MSHPTFARKLALGILGAGVVAGASWWISSSPSQHQIATNQTAPSGRLASSAPPALAARKLSVDTSVRATLVDYAKQPASTIALDPDGAERSKSAMHAWTSRVMNLDAANQRESTRFDRTSYTNQQARDVPMHLGDRRGKDGTFADAPRASSGWVAVVYRESTNGHEMSFQKLGKDKSVPTGDGLPEGEATKQAQSFLTENGLIGETGPDTIGRREVRRRHVNQEQATGEGDFLVQQDIVLRRSFQGKPVINASAAVGVLPANNEIVELKVSNWTPVSTKADAQTVIKPSFDSARASKLAAQLEQQLAAVLADQYGEDAANAIVRGVEDSWFMSEHEGLIPALVFAVEIGDVGERHTVAVPMTPYHDSAQIWQQGRKVRPAVEPVSPE